MFGWLFGKKPHVWRPREVLLYGYFDGQKEVRRDPMPLYRKLVAVWPELEVDTQLAASELAQTKDQLSAQAEVAVKARAIFDLKPHEEGGLPEREATLLLWDFWNWVGGVKKNTRPTATSVTATSAATGTTSAEGSPTRSTSDSGSTATGPPTGPPSPSTTPSASPST